MWAEHRSRALLAEFSVPTAAGGSARLLVANVHLEGSPYRPNDRVNQASVWSCMCDCVGGAEWAWEVVAIALRRPCTAVEKLQCLEGVAWGRVSGLSWVVCCLCVWNVQVVCGRRRVLGDLAVPCASRTDSKRNHHETFLCSWSLEQHEIHSRRSIGAAQGGPFVV